MLLLIKVDHGLLAIERDTVFSAQVRNVRSLSSLYSSHKPHL